MNKLPLELKALIKKLKPEHLPISTEPLEATEHLKIHCKNEILIAKKLNTSNTLNTNPFKQYQKASELGISQKLLALDNQSGWLIHQWLPGLTLRTSDINDPTIQQQLATILGKIHQHKQPNTTKTLPNLARLTLTEFDQLPSSLQKLILTTKQQKQLNNLLSEIIQLPHTLCWTHQDFHPKNLLLTENQDIFLIDWDLAGMAMPEIDVAMLMQYLPEQLQQTWIDCYHQYSNQTIKRTNIDFWYQFLTLKCVVWATLQAQHHYPVHLTNFNDQFAALLNQGSTTHYQSFQQAFLNSTFDYSSWQSWAELAISNLKRINTQQLLQ